MEGALLGKGQDDSSARLSFELQTEVTSSNKAIYRKGDNIAMS